MLDCERLCLKKDAAPLRGVYMYAHVGRNQDSIVGRASAFRMYRPQ